MSNLALSAGMEHINKQIRAIKRNKTNHDGRQTWHDYIVENWERHEAEVEAYWDGE